MNSESAPVPDIDEKSLWAYLAGRVPGFREPAELKRFSGGMSNPTYLIVTPDGRYVMRKKPAGALLHTAHQVEREYRVIHSLRDSGVPAPEAFHLCEDPDVIGSTFYVMECVDGVVVHNPTLPDFNPDERTKIYDSWNDAIARVHRIDWRAAGLESFGRHENYLPRQIERWSKQFTASKTHDIPSFDCLREWLLAHLPNQEPVRLIHGDCSMANCIIDPATSRIAALLDWELSTLGDPLADLAHSCKPWCLEPSERGFSGHDPASTGIPALADFLDAYCVRTGRASIRQQWPFYMAFALFRSAAILQGVYSRALQGNAASAGAREIGAQAMAVADRGWAIATGRYDPLQPRLKHQD